MTHDELLEPSPEPDEDDVLAASAEAGTELGGIRHAISDAFVGFFKEYYGKGPTRCRTHFEQDLIVVVLRGCYTRAEHTLIDAGMWREVRDARHAWQMVMGDRFRAKIEELTGRQVEAFMSTSHHDPDVTMEVFTLAQKEDG